VNTDGKCFLCSSPDYDESLETARGYLAQRMAELLEPDWKKICRRLRVTRATWRNWLNGRYAPDARNFRALIEATGGIFTRDLCDAHRLAASRCSRARLSERDAISIVARFRAGEDVDAIAASFPQVTPRHIRQVVRGARYSQRTVFGE
jgi:transcriptional regulator with XRE-family HTH domain